MEENQTGELSEETKEIVELGSAKIKNSRGNVTCITIIGQIEGHIFLPPQHKATKYEHIIPQLITVEEDESVDGLLIILNTVGGDVEAGLALSEMVASMQKPTVSLVLGGGHSIGVPLAVSAKYSYIAPSAAMTLHPIRMNGMIIGVPQTFEYLDRMQDRVISFITSNSKIDRQTLRKLILNTSELANDIGTVLFGEEAVKSGLIDSVGGVKDALGTLYDMIAEVKKQKK